jgi:predicted ATPase
VVGAGGIGKTSVAVAAAGGLGSFVHDRICFVEFGTVEDPNKVADTLAAALGLPVGGDDLPGEIANTFGSREMLIVVDGCEHVIDAAATLIDKIVAATPNVSFLVTSREALRIELERVYLLEALAAPPIDRDLSATEVLSYPAARLFLERAGPASDVVSLDRSANLVARICSRLDGLALAIEMAAGQAQFYGIEELAEMLEDGLSLTWRGRRTAPARHQTLVAMLEWGYRLLSEEEKSALRILSIFSGQFSLEDAVAAADKGMTGIDATFALAQLVSKSLVSVSSSNKGTQYRLLDTTRAYAREKFADAGENRGPRATRQ